MKKKILTAGLFAAIGVSALFAQQGITNINSNEQELVPGMTNLILGGGYSSDRMDAVPIPETVMNTDSCVIEGSTSADIELRQCEDSTEYSIQLGANLNESSSSGNKLKKTLLANKVKNTQNASSNGIKANDDTVQKNINDKDEKGFYIVDVLSNDEPKGGLSLTGLRNQDGISDSDFVDNDKNSVKILPKTGAKKMVLEYTVEDSDGNSANAKLTCTLSEAATGPVAVGDTYDLLNSSIQTDAEGYYLLNVMDNDTNTDSGVTIDIVNKLAKCTAGYTQDKKQVRVLPDNGATTMTCEYKIKNSNSLKSDFATVTCTLANGGGAVNPFVSFLRDRGKYSENLYYIEKIQLKSKLITAYGENGLTNFGKEFYSQGPDKFRDVCGNKFVQKITYGAVLFVTYKINFKTYEDKIRFDIKYKGKAGITDLPIELKKSGINGTLDLAAYQIGGDPGDLAKIFNQKPGNSYYKVSADIKDAPDYFAGLSGQVLSYAAGEFSQQVGFDAERQEFIGNVAPIGCVLKDYTDIGLNVGPSVITADIRNARQTLNSYKHKVESCKTVIDHMLENLNTFIAQDMKDTLNEYQRELNYDLELMNDLDNGINQCYQHPDKTMEIYNALMTGFIGYDIIDEIQKTADFYSNAYLVSGDIDDTYFYPLNYKLNTYIVSENPSFEKYSYGQVKFSDDKSSATINTEDAKDGLIIDNQTLNKNMAGNYSGKIKIEGKGTGLFHNKNVELTSLENPI